MGATLVLNRMSQTGASLSEIHQTLPQFEIVKDKVNLEGIDLDGLMQKVESLFHDAEKNIVDGIKFSWDDRWVHLRKSNTEPIMRIYAEAPMENQAIDLVKKIQSLL